MSDESKVIVKDYSGIGVVFTILYVVVVLIIMVLTRDRFLDLSPNEWGDFLAGVFGPLALGWVVISTFQQREELRQNTRALNLQVDELKQSVEQQTLLAEANRQMIEHEVHKTHIMAQPLFSPVYCTEATGMVVVIGFINRGQPAINVVLSFDDVPEGVSGDNPGFVASGSTFELSFKWEGMNFPQPLYINYKDALRNPQEDVFIISKSFNEHGLSSIHIDSAIDYD